MQPQPHFVRLSAANWLCRENSNVTFCTLAQLHAVIMGVAPSRFAHANLWRWNLTAHTIILKVLHTQEVYFLAIASSPV